MNTATKNLEDDHIHILRLIKIIEKISGGVNPDTNHIKEVVILIREFADGLHHAKEENHFFPKLEEKGFSSQQGPVAVMLHEHTQGRAFVKGIAENIVLFENGEKSALKEVLINMQGYAELLQNHIAKENNILFRMADKVLSQQDQEDLLEKFSKAEKLHGPAGKPEEYITRIESLGNIYKV